ncbi:LysR substrate-binding domain-containing protein [Neptuniibacter caesariensis]|uniref:Regulatory protein, LysR:LysR, substrate-binding n=1 Tax=Neptuniibacter caesariensis TaxID=207954 RepID=A0A7U8GT02_NEPCE|nr:LysR substrate-binding domain-containing protein [Neptuniibacter caesariensis]EAR61630.1 regulatory protein, LysR:LysR, substrate-binding [Oceanospirillum sp. MED92] [Neptuniibacter caesariensis]
MHKTIPPLRALVAFEASVRHGSFKQAAVELNITPGAVSQQVIKLESWLGYPLFIRQVRKLKVTEQGMSYFSLIAPALEQISAASKTYRQQQENRVAISLTQALASKWLGPRLADFVSKHPDIEVHINASNSPVDFYTDQIDLAIRHFNGIDPQLEIQLAFEDEMRLFCSPDYQRQHKLFSMDTLLHTTLIVTTLQPFWEQWLDRFTTINAEQRNRISRLHFDQALLSIDAARRGQGVVLTNALLVQEELKHGELIEPFANSLPLEKHYYLVHPKQQPLNTAACTFKAWLLEQFSA